MLSIRPKVAELAFHLFSRPLHPELTEVFQSRAVVRNDYQAKIDITSCGHVVTFNAHGATLCEVASSVTQPLPMRRCLIHQSLKGSRTAEATCQSGVNYRTHYQLETVEPEMFWMMGQQLGKGPTEGLLHLFDSSGRMALGAMSYVSIQSRSRSMLVQAIHTFPDDYAIVKVESLFMLPKSA